MTSKPKWSFENILDPDTLRPNLIAVALYIAAFELLKTSIIDRLKSFFSTPGSSSPDPEYTTEVQSRNASPVYASLMWLKASNAIDDTDLANFEKIKEIRNNCAHAITSILTSGLPAGFTASFAEMNSLLAKIERWWLINVDIATDPAFDGKEVDADEVMPGSVIALRIMMEVALGPDSEARKYIDELKKR